MHDLHARQNGRPMTRSDNPREAIERSGTIEMTGSGLVMPVDLVGFTGQLVVEWPSEEMQKQILSISEPGLPEVCDYICRGVMPSSSDANGVPGGHLRIGGELYKIEDSRTEVN